jgi:hypothetical protein
VIAVSRTPRNVPPAFIAHDGSAIGLVLFGRLLLQTMIASRRYVG